MSKVQIKRTKCIKRFCQLFSRSHLKGRNGGRLDTTTAIRAGNMPHLFRAHFPANCAECRPISRPFAYDGRDVDGILKGDSVYVRHVADARNRRDVSTVDINIARPATANGLSLSFVPSSRNEAMAEQNICAAGGKIE